MNDWPIKRFLIITLTLLSLLGLVGLDFIGLGIPILREVIGFLFLTFIPGLLLLRILRLHNLHPIESILYSVGSSLSIIMVLGLFIDLTYPALGIAKPLSILPLIISLTTLTVALCTICYVGDKDFFSSTSLNSIRQLLSPYPLFLLVVPFLSIFGAYVMNVYDSNVLILILLFIVSLFPVLIAFNKLPEKLHGLAIFVVSISILFHVSLISWHIWGWDIHIYSYWTNLTRENSYWNPTISSPRNALLLPTVLPVVYSVITGLNTVWVFKLFFPFFFSLVPVGIYSTCRNQFSSKVIPALAPFPFMFYYAFFETFPFKQFVSELFLVLLVMLVVDKKIPSFGKKILAIFFSFSLIVSHHGVSHLFLLILIFAIILLALPQLKTKSNVTKPQFGALFFVLLTGWFMFTCGGARFEVIVDLGHNIITSLSKIIHSPAYRSGIGYATRKMPTSLWTAYKYLNILMQIFIISGIFQLLVSLIKKKRICRSNDFAALSLGFYGFLASSIILTFGWGFDRIMQITLVLLAPFAVIGCRNIFELLTGGLKLISHRAPVANSNPSLKFFGVFLMIFLLFSSGFVFEVTGEDTPPYCVALSKDNWKHWNGYYQAEVRGARWVKKYSSNDTVSSLPGKKWTSKDTVLLAEHYLHREDFIYFKHDTISLPSDICVYVGNLAAKKGKIPCKVEGKPQYKIKYLRLDETPFYQEVLTKSYKVFDGGRAYVYSIP